MKKWDVVLIQYPFTDLTVVKLQPAVVVSPDDFNASQDVVVAAITTSIADISRYEFLIPNTHPEFASTGLNQQSAARMDKIFTLDKKLINSIIGKFGPTLQQEAVKLLRLFFGL